MNITFLIGNGFDLSVGADTSYSAFYRWYCKQPSEAAHIKNFKEAIQENIESGNENWADFEVALGQYTNQFSPDTVGQFLDCVEDAREKMMVFLKDVTEKPEICASQKNVTALRNSVRGFYQELPLEEHNKIEALLNSNFLENIDAKFLSFNYTDLLDKCVSCLSSKPLAEWGDGTIYKREFSVNPKVLHVHGRTSYYPVMGVNDDSQVVNQKLLLAPYLKEIIIKPKCVDAMRESWHTEAEQQIKGSQIICIMGMSLGPTDAKWWKQIIDWLSEDSKRHLILFWFIKDEEQYQLNHIDVRNRIKYERERADGISTAQNHLLRYAENGEANDESIRSRIHVVINTKKFMKVSFTQEDEPKIIPAGTPQDKALV